MGSQEEAGPRFNDEVMPIAVIGLGFRGPGDATDPSRFYQMIFEGREAWSPVPQSRWNNDAFYHPDANKNGTSNVEGCHFLTEDLARFDAPFFNLTQAEAEALDPQQRLLLECCYEGLENAGLPLGSVVGSNTSVFVGAASSDYTEMLLRDAEKMPLYQATGSSQSRAMMSNRLSYFFDFRGPSVSVDTACSAGLVALHLACQSLQTGEADQAIAAGVNVILGHEFLNSMSTMRFLSPNGRCYTFDERANGYGRGEGVGCVILKPLEQALRDGDPIRGVIRNTGVNQDGRTAGITLPNRHAQEALIRRVYEKAGLDPLETSYVECHGTGTRAGDPLEASAIASVFSPGRPSHRPLWIGSVKTNIGHLEGASGMAGLIKLVHMLETKTILPNRNFETPNKSIPFADWNLKVPTVPEPWSNDNGIRRASINSFGYGGTNVHCILEEAEGYLRSRGIPPAQLRPPTVLSHKESLVPGAVNGHGSLCREGVLQEDISESARVFVLSSFDETSGKAWAKRLADYLESLPRYKDGFIDDLAYLLSERRTRHLWRAAFVASSRDQLVQALKADTVKFTKSNPERPLLGFVFTGQGAQWHAMGRELIDIYPVFDHSICRAARHLQKLGAAWDLKDELSKTAEESRVSRAFLSQPLCTAIQIALVDLLASWDILPASVTGHSSGEIAAAYAAGALSMEDAMAVAFHRGVVSDLIMNNPSVRGGMMAVGLSKEAALPYLASVKRGLVTVACINSPSSITVSGDKPAINELFEILEKDKVFARQLKVDVAYHSRHMQVVADEYLQAIADIRVLNPCHNVQFFSSVSGTQVDASTLGPKYWVSNLLGEVRFCQSLGSLCTDTSPPKKSRKRQSTSAISVLVEIGPHSALAGPVRQIIEADRQLRNSNITYSSMLVRDRNAVQTSQQLVSTLLVRGYPVNVLAINSGAPSRSQPAPLVDLPPYSWNHSKAFWAESRISKAYRAPPFGRHDLLGLPDPSSTSLESRWRNMIRVSEIPWLKDHQVLSSIVFPGAGYLAMVIEAAMRQVQIRSGKVKGFCLREIVIGQALVFPAASEEVEALVTLKPHMDSLMAPSNAWYEFSVLSAADEDRWTEHCRGLVHVQEAKRSTNDVNGDLQQTSERRLYKDFVADFNGCCTSAFDVEDLYRRLRALGLDFGPTFTNLETAYVAANKAKCILRVPNTRAVMPMEYESSMTIHPATLDALFQAIFPAVEAATGPLQAPLMPISIQELRVSSTIMNHPGKAMNVFAETERRNPRQVAATITSMMEGQDEEPIVSIKDLVCTFVNENSRDCNQDSLLQLANRVSWAQDVEFLSPLDIDNICSDIMPGSKENAVIAVLEQAAFHYMQRAVSTCTQETVQKMHPYHQLLWKCMNWFIQETLEGKIHLPTTGWYEAKEEEVEIIMRQAESSGSEGRLLCHVGRHLPQILRQEIEPLQLMLEEDRLAAYYSDNPRLERNYRQATRYLELLAHKNPGMSILEIGAGTGGATVPVIEALDRGTSGGHCCSRYHFTDISSGFFAAAKEKLNAWSHLIDFSRLDIEQDPITQGFKAQSYDLVIASNVLHATHSMETTMSNVRSLLKPGGKLILVEITRKRLLTSTIFGTLPGWWAGAKDGRDQAPTLTESQWQTLLQKTGFSGLDAAVWDSPNEGMHQGSMMVSTAVDAAPVRDLGPKGRHVAVMVNSLHGDISQDYLEARLSSWATTVEVGTIKSITPAGKICIILDYNGPSLLSQPDSEQLESLKRIAATAAGILWVVQGSASPTGHLAIGFARTIRSEYGGIRVAVLDLDSVTTTKDQGAAAGTITKVVMKLFTNLEDDKGLSPELEMAEHGGHIFIPRLVADREASRAINSLLTKGELELSAFDQPDRPLYLEVGMPGMLDTIQFVDDTRVMADLAPGYVEIKIQAVGVNFKDVMMAMGQVDYSSPGLEYSGIVTAIGSQVQNLAVGDHVAGYSSGAFANRIYEKACGVQVIPAGMSFEIAASLPIIYCTAYYSLHEIARLREGESILIHAAAGGVGQALIELSRQMGAEIFVTVGNPKKKEFLMSHFGIPEDHIFFSRDGTFHQDVFRMTNGKGVDVVINSVAGEMLRLTWRCIAAFGRFIELGSRDYTINTRLEMAPFARNTTFSAVNLDGVMRERPLVAARVWSEVMDLIRAQRVRPPSPITTYGISEVETAFRTMQTGKHMGKLVIVPQPGERVKVAPRSDDSLFRADASYMLVGGLGGLGRAVAAWMADCGVRNFVFLSRSGAQSSAAQETVRQLEATGARVLVQACDISDDAQVTRAMQTAKDMPPIRGVIQGAMVLRDSLLENLGLDDYNAVIRPKVQGTWNLHNLLPRDLDFFLMLSSTCGIVGNASQAPYAASSTFLDAFAQYRRRLGLQATTIDLGVILEVGYVSENQELTRALDRQGFVGTTKKELLAILSAAIRQRTDGPSQIVTGLGTWQEDSSLLAFQEPMFSHFRHTSTRSDIKVGDNSMQDKSVRLRDVLRNVTEASEAKKLVKDGIISKVSTLSMISVDEIDDSLSLSTYGVDSLVAVEMRNWISKELDAPVTILELLANEPLESFANKMARRSKVLESSVFNK